MTSVGVVENNSPIRDAAFDFYGISDNVNRGPSADLDHEKTRAFTPPTGPPTPAEQQQLCMDQTEAESSKPPGISVNSGRDTEAIMAAVASPPPDYDPDKVGASDLTSPRIGGLDRSRGERLQRTGSHVQGGSSIGPARPPEPIVQNAGEDSATETVENENWVGHILQKAITGAVSTIGGILRSQVDDNDRTIRKLTRRNERKEREIQHLKQEIHVLQDHSSLMEIRCTHAEELLREAKASAAELKNDIARLSNAQPELTKDDQYFMTKFSGVFFSLESWVLQHFMHSKIDPAILQSLPAGSELIDGLCFILGEGWEIFASEETLHSIEAVATVIMQKMIFDIRMLGILKDWFPEIEQYFGCSVEVINAWRVQTTRMILCDVGFHSRVEKRVCEVVDHIEKLLGPLGDQAVGGSSPKRALARKRRLKAIIEQAAELAVECNKEPSTFTFQHYSAGFGCQSSYMTDADRAVDDEHLGVDGACVKFTVSPAVLRAPKKANDEPIVILKARVVRHPRESPGSVKGIETHGQDDIGNINGITGAQLDQTYDSSDDQL